MRCSVTLIVSVEPYLTQAVSTRMVAATASSACFQISCCASSSATCRDGIEQLTVSCSTRWEAGGRFDPIELTSASDFLASTMRPRGTKGLVEEDALSLLSGIRCLWIGMGRRGGGDAGR